MSGGSKASLNGTLQARRKFYIVKTIIGLPITDQFMRIIGARIMLNNEVISYASLLESSVSASKVSVTAA